MPSESGDRRTPRQRANESSFSLSHHPTMLGVQEGASHERKKLQQGTSHLDAQIELNYRLVPFLAQRTAAVAAQIATQLDGEPPGKIDLHDSKIQREHIRHKTADPCVERSAGAVTSSRLADPHGEQLRPPFGERLRVEQQRSNLIHGAHGAPRISESIVAAKKTKTPVGPRTNGDRGDAC